MNHKQFYLTIFIYYISITYITMDSVPHSFPILSAQDQITKEYFFISFGSDEQQEALIIFKQFYNKILNQDVDQLDLKLLKLSAIFCQQSLKEFIHTSCSHKFSYSNFCDKLFRSFYKFSNGKNKIKFYKSNRFLLILQHIKNNIFIQNIYNIFILNYKLIRQNNSYIKNHYNLLQSKVLSNNEIINLINNDIIIIYEPKETLWNSFIDN